MKRVAIVQSCYIPWKGYFDIIDAVDEFILYDEVQYTKRDWRNRNLIKTQQGLKWLTIPVKVKGRFTQKISETVIDSPDWVEKHLDAIKYSYSEASSFGHEFGYIEKLYESCLEERSLSRINKKIIVEIAGWLRLKTVIADSRSYSLKGDRTERLVNVCRQARADVYVSGPSAKAYLDVSKFETQGILVKWMNYNGYPEYPQLYTPPFVHEVTILDLLLNVGFDNARHYMLNAVGNSL